MKNVYFKRKIYEKLLRWKADENGRSALLIEGARRVGKSTIAKTFAQNEYKSYILIDFSNLDNEIRDLISNNISNLDYFFLRLQVITGVSLEVRNSVIIFDEVQLMPVARQAIKHLVADGRYDYIETGSLISIRKNVSSILIPSEEERVKMYPMDFEEFCWAVGNDVSLPLLRQVFDAQMSVGDAANRSMMRQLRLYMLVGGMPQAVNEYIATNDLVRVDKVKRKIIDLYVEDFQKLDSTGKAKAIFLSVPGALAKNEARYYSSSVSENTRRDSIRDVLANMQDSMCINIAYHATDPNIGFSLSEDVNKYKIYISDTGLFVTLAFWDKDFTENVIYNKLLNDKLSADLGYVYENLVSQMLVASGNKLFYYTFPTPNKHNYEIDFLLSRGNKICPIEVKSSGYKSHSSLDAFSEKYSSRISSKYLIYSKDFCIEDGISYLPFYMTMFI